MKTSSFSMYSVLRSIILNEQMYEPKTDTTVSQYHTEEHTPPPPSMKHLLFTQFANTRVVLVI